jgi:fatty acid desaturase
VQIRFGCGLDSRIYGRSSVYTVIISIIMCVGCTGATLLICSVSINLNWVICLLPNGCIISCLLKLQHETGINELSSAHPYSLQ